MFPDDIDWNRASEAEIAEAQELLEAELSERDKHEIDMRLWGRYVLFRAKEVSWRANNEVLAVIAEWQDDPDMLRRHEIKDEKVYDWATIKRDQRSYDRRLQVEKLKKYWRKVRAHRERLRELERFVPDKARTDSKVTMPLKPGFLDGIVAPFSTETQERERVNAFFEKALERPHIQRLPLKELIFSERVTQFSDLPTYTDDPRLERAAKFSAVLRLETDGLVELWQAVPFSDITIKRVAEMEMEVSGTNREGGMEMIDLSDASSRQVCLAKIRSSVFASVGRVTDARYKICRQSRQPD